MKFLLDRLFKASRAYYLMHENGGCEVKEIKEEMVAALVDVKLSFDPRPTSLESLEVDINRLHRHADRRKEWSAAKVVFNGNTGDYLG